MVRPSTSVFPDASSVSGTADRLTPSSAWRNRRVTASMSPSSNTPAQSTARFSTAPLLRTSTTSAVWSVSPTICADRTVAVSAVPSTTTAA